MPNKKINKVEDLNNNSNFDMKKTKEELKEEATESVTEEPAENVDYDVEIERCRTKLIALDNFYREKKSMIENEIKELQEKRDTKESVKAINNLISRLVDGGLSRDRAEDIAAEYIRKNMGLRSTEKKRVSYVDYDGKPLASNAKFSDIADKIATSFALVTE